MPSTVAVVLTGRTGRITCRCITPTSVCLCVHARQRACVGVCIRARNWRKRTHHPAPPTMSGTLHDCAVGALPWTPRNVRVAVCRTRAMLPTPRCLQERRRTDDCAKLAGAGSHCNYEKKRSAASSFIPYLKYLFKVSMTVTYSQRQEYPHFVGRHYRSPPLPAPLLL